MTISIRKGLNDRSQIAKIDELTRYRLSVEGSVQRSRQEKIEESITAADFGVDTEEELRSAVYNANINYNIKYGGESWVNGTYSTSGVWNAANFAQQGEGSEPTGFIFHHYTDGTMVQMDNVGDGATLVLKLANNPVRRADKASNYVGGGVFLQLVKQHATTLVAESLFYISKLSEFVWTGQAGTAVLWQNKEEDSTPAFRHKTTNKHLYLSAVENGSGNVVMYEKNDVTYTRYVIESQTTMTNGMLFEAKAGSVQLKAANYVLTYNPIRAVTGDLEFQVSDSTSDTVKLTSALELRQWTTASRPTLDSGKRCLAWNSDTNRPMIWNGSAWSDL